MYERKTTLGEFIIQEQKKSPNASGDLTKILSSIKLAAKEVNYLINRGRLENIFGTLGKNIQGEQQTKLDVLANQIFIESLKARREVCAIGSEEMENIIKFSGNEHNESKYIVLIDPLDGSSNIDVNVSVGTIFSIYNRITPKKGKVTTADFLQKGREQVVAGYVLYGSSSMLVLTSGKGVNGFTLDPKIGSFFLSHPNIKIPKSGKIYSVNEGNYVHFPQGVKNLLKHYQKKDETLKLPLTSRYIGSLVSDFHRNMIKGGIYLYPEGTLSPQGKLRLLYECNPIAFIAEQAGGLATNGVIPILDIQPSELHQRTPFFAGSKDLVEEAHTFIKNSLKIT